MTKFTNAKQKSVFSDDDPAGMAILTLKLVELQRRNEQAGVFD
jgi:hypothetical protein